LRRGNYRAAARILGVRPGKKLPRALWANKWLEWKYGWMPLLNDVYESVGAIDRVLAKETWRRKASKIWRFRIAAQSLVGSGWGRGLCVSEGQVGVHCRLDFKLTEYPSSSALGLTNPALVAWELLPFSFVLDWMVPVSEWLHGMDHNDFFKEGSSCITRYTKQTWKFLGHDWSEEDALYKIDRSNSWSATKEYVYIRRRISPLLTPDFPRLRNPLNGFNRMFTALALLRQQIKR
jgi:hypothetical protein